jgi:tyrosyl-tRNA synthetase
MESTIKNTQLFIQELKNRTLFYQTIDNKQEIAINSIYCGFDATAPSLQIGNLICLATLRLCAEYNIKTIALLGGATTKVGGDPTDKTQTRKKIENQAIEENLQIIEQQIKNLVPQAKLVNNAKWLEKLNFVDFLENIARYIPVGALLKLQMFANRLENNNPLNLQELLYPIMQGYDFLWLYENENCNAQLGGSDQWCNLLTGIDLIKQKHNDAKATALTIPLLTNAAGAKLGKSENGAIFINPNLCSPYDFWQYWRNIDDVMIKPCLKKLTLVPIEEIEAIKDINQAKVLLANEVTKWVHGQENAQNAEQKAKAIFVEGNIESAQTKNVKSNKLSEIIVEVSENTTNSQAKTLIEQGAIKVNNQTIFEKTYIVNTNEFILHIGKKKIYKIKIE